MAIELRMPALSPTMEKGTLAKWLVAVGDVIEPGGIVAEIETDKATMEVEVADPGRIVELLLPEGSEDVPVGTVIALIAENDDPLSEPVAAAPPAPSVSIGSPSPNTTPLVQRIAGVMAIDLDGIVGSGPHGRIVRADLKLPRLVGERPDVEPFVPRSASQNFASSPAVNDRIVPFVLTAKCDLDRLLGLLSELNLEMEASGLVLTVGDLLIKAVAKALVAVPETNVCFDGDDIRHCSRVDISPAVATAGGLVWPVMRGVERLSLSTIARQSRDLAARARDGSLDPEDRFGGTASIIDLGTYGIDGIVPALDQSRALAFGTAAGSRLPWDKDGEIALAAIMSVTAIFDPRAIDELAAAQCMRALKDRIENPLQLVA